MEEIIRLCTSGSPTLAFSLSYQSLTNESRMWSISFWNGRVSPKSVATGFRPSALKK